MPMLIGVTTNELSNSIPIDKGFGTDAAILAHLKTTYPYISNATFQQLLDLYPVSRFNNTGPPLSGAQWNRVVAIVNDLQVFCPTTEQALQVSNVANVFKCMFPLRLGSFELTLSRSLGFYAELHLGSYVARRYVVYLRSIREKEH